MTEIIADQLQIITAQWVLPIHQAPIEQGFVAIRDGKILAVGPLSELPHEWTAEAPQPGTLLTPGLINTHLHLEQSFPEPIGKASDEPFCDWLLRVVAKIQQEGDSTSKTQRCLFGAKELLATGTTCVNDIASGSESLEVLNQLGLRGYVSLEVFHPGGEPIEIGHWVSKFRSLQDALSRYRQGTHSRLQVGLSPHSLYNVSPLAWRALLAECNPSLIHTHVAEFEDESKYLNGQPSCIQTLHQRVLGRQFQPEFLAESPVVYMQQGDLLNSRTIMAHAIHTREQDRALLAQAGVSVAHCPRSNLALHGRTLKTADWQPYAIPLALGTDGRLSTENLDLRAEARCAMQLQGWTAKEALKAMTSEGARALRLSEQVGTLRPGLAADLVLWHCAEPQSLSPEAQVLLPKTQVKQVLIAGQTRWPVESE